MKTYIEMNTKLCQQPGLSDFAKNFFKLLNNACFGKTMENFRRRKNLIIVTNTEQAKYYCNKFKVNRFNIFKVNLVGVTMIKKKIKWNKPTYLGAAILDVSKLQLYKFHYENMDLSMVGEHAFFINTRTRCSAKCKLQIYTKI